MNAVASKTKSPLADKIAAEGAIIGEYFGTETALNFGAIQAEFSALEKDCGIYDLCWRGRIAVSGADRTRWLNGMVTNNVKDLAINHSNYNFLLNAQGRIQGDMYVYNRGKRLLLDTERSQIAHLMKTLEHFVIMDDVELTDISDDMARIGVQGPKAQDILKACGLEADCAEPLVVCDVKWNGRILSVTSMANADHQIYEIWLEPAAAGSMWDSLKGAGAQPVGTNALEQFRVVAGIPKYGIDIRDRDLPQETGQTQALNFTKGCYIGQEIVERIRSRGNVHRSFTGLESTKRLENGSKVIAGGKEVGEITSVADVVIGGTERHIALGYLRREAFDMTLVSNGVPVRPAKLPFNI